MINQFKKYFSLFFLFLFLFLFLFPLIEKELHTIEHAYDVHCNATDKHFHELEHNCSICDYTVNDSFTSPQNSFLYVVLVKQLKFADECENIYIPSAFSDLPSRAPPIA